MLCSIVWGLAFILFILLDCLSPSLFEASLCPEGPQKLLVSVYCCSSLGVSVLGFSIAQGQKLVQ